MGLGLNPDSVFGEVAPEDLAEFKRTSHLSIQEKEAAEYRALLTHMALQGRLFRRGLVIAVLVWVVVQLPLSFRLSSYFA